MDGHVTNPEAIGDPEQTPVVALDAETVAAMKQAGLVCECGGMNGYHQDGCLVGDHSDLFCQRCGALGSQCRCSTSDRGSTNDLLDKLRSIEIMTRPGIGQAPATIVHTLVAGWLTDIDDADRGSKSHD